MLDVRRVTQVAVTADRSRRRAHSPPPGNQSSYQDGDLEVCQDGKMTHSLRLVVPSVTHKLRTVNEMRDTQCPRGRLSWLPVNFLLHVKCTLSYVHFTISS